MQPVDWYGLPSTPLTMSVRAVPQPGGSGVYRNSRFVLTFDDYPDPDTLPFGAVALTSGSALFDATVRVRLVDRAIEVRPRSLLWPNNLYLLSVSGIGSIGGRHVPDAGLGVRIGVGGELAELPSEPPPPQWADVRPHLEGCAVAGCHTQRDGKAPARNLVLDGDPRDSIYGLIGVPALSRRDTSARLARVAPGDAARSVLLRKLLGGDPSEAEAGERWPKMAIDGVRMPPWPAPPLDEATLHLIEAWIDGGAPVEAAPQ